MSECKMDVKSAWMDSYMAPNGSLELFSEHHLLEEVGLTQPWETMALRKFTTIHYYILSCLRTLHDY